MYTLTIIGDNISDVAVKLAQHARELESLSGRKGPKEPGNLAEPIASVRDHTTIIAVEKGKVASIETISDGVSFAGIKQAVLDVAKAKGKNASLEILKQFNDVKGQPCEKITALLEKDYAAVLVRAKQALEE